MILGCGRVSQRRPPHRQARRLTWEAVTRVAETRLKYTSLSPVLLEGPVAESEVPGRVNT